MAALRIYPDRYKITWRHINLTNKSQLKNIFSSSYLYSATVPANVTRNIATSPSPDVTCYAIQHRMLIKIDRQKAINNFPILPLRHYDEKKDEEIYSGPKVFANYVLTVPSKSYRGHQKLLGIQITFIAKNLEYDHLIFLGDIDIAWLQRLDTHENFQKELQYLADNKIGKRFSGALQVDTDELPTFLKNLSWLVRTNGIVPYIHFTDPEQNIVGDICQYGNLHISTKNKTADKKLKAIISESQFEYLTDTNCHNKFSKSGAIKGRTITV